MQLARTYPRSVAGRWAWIAPAMVLVCAAVLLVFANTLSNEGLAWAVAATQSWDMSSSATITAIGLLLAASGGLLLVCVGMVVAGDLWGEWTLLSIVGAIGAVATILAGFALTQLERSPLSSLHTHANMQQAIAGAERGDQIAGKMSGLVHNPTYEGIRQGKMTLESALIGEELDRALVAADIIGLDAMDPVRRAKTRGWMAQEEFDALKVVVVEKLRREGQGKNQAWQAAALALVDRQALAEPLAFRARGRDVR